MIITDTNVYICPRCGEVALAEDLTEQHVIYEDGMLGRFAVGVGYSIKTCDCGGEFVPALKCEECGEVYPLDELDEDCICINCRF